MVLPADTGTMTRIDFDGQLWACAMRETNGAGSPLPQAGNFDDG
jgi:hypothetical protein